MKTPRRALLVIATTALLTFARAQDPASTFEVKVNQRPVELHGFLQGDFGLFEQRGPVDVEVRAPFNVRWVDVRPRSSRITPSIGADHRTVRFHLAVPLPVTVEFNDDLSKVLHLFAYEPEKNPPIPGTPNVRYFGSGLHEGGLMDLKDGETLYLAPGAWVKGWVRSVGTHGISIRGRGVLDGSGSRVSPESADLASSAAPSPGERRSSEARAAAYGMGTKNMIYLKNTVGAKIEGITIFNSPGWTVVDRGTRGTRIDGIRILNPSNSYGDDGIDIVSSSDFQVDGAFIRTNDDCVVVKNLDDVPTHDIGVRRCVLWNMPTGGNGIEIGFELGHTLVSRIRFEDIDIIHVQRGSALSIHNGDSANVEDVTYNDIRVEDVRRKLVDFCVLYAQYGLDLPTSAQERARRLDTGGVWDGELSLVAAEVPAVAKNRGHIRNVTIAKLAVLEGSLPYSVVAGFDGDHAIEGVRVSGLTYLGRPIHTLSESKFVTEFAPGFELK
jgi:hypothetical protein